MKIGHAVIMFMIQLSIGQEINNSSFHKTIFNKDYIRSENDDMKLFFRSYNN